MSVTLFSRWMLLQYSSDLCNCISTPLEVDKSFAPSQLSNGMYHNPLRWLQFPFNISLPLYLIVQDFLLNKASHPLSQNCPIDNKLVFMFGKPWAIRALFGKCCAIDISPFDEDWILLPSGCRTVIGICTVLWFISSSFRKCEVHPVSAAATDLRGVWEKLSKVHNYHLF